jgi:hypothetical protein
MAHRADSEGRSMPEAAPDTGPTPFLMRRPGDPSGLGFRIHAEAALNEVGEALAGA